MRPTKTKALELLAQQRDKIADVRKVKSDSPEFAKWWNLTQTIISNIFGQESPQELRFGQIEYGLLAFSSNTPESSWHRAYLQGLDSGEAQLEALTAR